MNVLLAAGSGKTSVINLLAPAGGAHVMFFISVNSCATPNCGGGRNIETFRLNITQILISK